MTSNELLAAYGAGNRAFCDAYLRGANLGGADLRGADLGSANLRCADLRCADLSGADLVGADLRSAGLSGADLRGAIGLPAAPSIPGLDAKILAAVATGGSLNMRTWHTCETTHCRAGWAIAIAGATGAELEESIGPCAAGALIYYASTGCVPDFFASNEDALADIRKCAEVRS